MKKNLKKEKFKNERKPVAEKLDQSVSCAVMTAENIRMMRVAYAPIKSITYTPIKSIAYTPIKSIAYEPIQKCQTNLDRDCNCLNVKQCEL